MGTSTFCSVLDQEIILILPEMGMGGMHDAYKIILCFTCFLSLCQFIEPLLNVGQYLV